MYKILGISVENITCDKCGKINLGKTIVLESPAGSTVYFGVDCAARALLGENIGKQKYTTVLSWANAVSYAKYLMPKHSLKLVALVVRNKYGFPTEIKNGALRIWITRNEYVELVES